MATKMNFLPNGVAQLVSDGEYSVEVDSVLGHRFSLVDGQVVDKYNGVSDDEVKQLDYAQAVALAQEKGEEPPPAP